MGQEEMVMEVVADEETQGHDQQTELANEE
jgi:hypothetical protein